MKIPKAESKTVEFKTAFNQDVIVSLVAFANADGGDVYVGVRDDGNVVGVQLAAESETTWINEIKNKTAPAIVPEADRIVVGKKTVVRLHIAPLPVKPTSVQGRYYIRKAKSNHLMTVAELSDMYLKSTSSSWDAFPSGKTLEDISLEKVAAFAKRMNPDNPDDPMRLLRKLGLADGGQISHACYLAFADGHCAETLFMTGRFKDATTIIDSQSLNADLFEEVKEVMAFIMRHLMKGFVITGRPEHDIVYDYPVDAIREIVLNMLIHRDYCAAGQNTIKIFDDRIEFSNPGGLPSGLTVDDLLSDNYRSRPRNPRIAELFRSCGMIEQYGSGVKRILAACERHRGIKATFEDHGDWFLAVLRKAPHGEVARGGTLNGTLNGTLSGTLNASDRRVLEYVEANPGCRASAIIAETSIPRDTLNKIIARLAKSGKVERRGSKKTGGYYKLGPFL